MKVIICEDEQNQRHFLQTTIMNYAAFYETSIEIVLSASQPEEVVTYLSNHRADCYFLDIEFGTTMNGIDLASHIRQQDPLATIIFITTHADKLKLTFTYKLAALDFIIKDVPGELTEQVRNALKAAFAKYRQLGQTDATKYFQVHIGERIKNIKLDDIYYLETSPQPHKIELHEKNGYYEFYGKMKDFEKLGEDFFRCHKSYIVNLRHVKDINKKERTLTIANDAVCPVSFRMMRELQIRIAKLAQLSQGSS
ncbi:LytR/AlgR family response regulator transcription factor [Planococcus maitriensis]|uniref:DNA-binding response regulator n=1 Tax=Planococcus maitriensis TaxID=221799 RepID=A0A365K3Z7_9BACL|nr:LytTR family DNA-binding domain-containing protein [Planococcus maitriensis]RAZ67295.1 DNA-binding response regulator [Planococcus maitriensis]